MTATLTAFGNRPASEVLNLYISSLAFPRNPSHCARCLHGCLISLCHPTYGLDNIPILRSSEPQFLRSTMTFLMVTRSEAELESLQQSFDTVVCSCDMSDECVLEMHCIAAHLIRTQSGRQNYFECLVRAMMDLINSALQHAITASACDFAGRSILNSPSWPESPNDVVPFGPESIISFSSMVSIAPSPSALSILDVAFSMCGESLVQPFLSSPTMAGKLVDVGALPIAIWATHDPVTGLCGLRHTAADLAEQVRTTARLCKRLLSLCKPHDLVRLYNQSFAQSTSADDLLSFCEGMVAWLPELKQQTPTSLPYLRAIAGSVSYATDIFADLGANLYYHLQQDLTTSPRSRKSKVVYHRYVKLFPSKDRDRETAYTSAYETLAKLRSRDRCWNPGCKLTPDTVEQGARRGSVGFPVCDGCGIVCYCSVDCQTAAWWHAKVPHQELCRCLNEVVERTGVGGAIGRRGSSVSIGSASGGSSMGAGVHRRGSTKPEKTVFIEDCRKLGDGLLKPVEVVANFLKRFEKIEHVMEQAS